MVEEGITAIGCLCLTEMELEYVYLPASLEHMSESAFGNPTGARYIENLHIADIAAWCDVEFVSEFFCTPVAYAKNLYENGELITNLVIPEGVESISNYAFCMAPVESLTIPESVTAIGDMAFAYSTLKSATIHSALKTVGNIPFDGSEMEEMTFTSDAPADAANLFDIGWSNPYTVIPADITAYYPANNETWTEEIMNQDYGAYMIWFPYDPAEGIPEGPFSGTCGENAAWRFEDGTLTISGTGAISDVENRGAPWYRHWNDIKTLVIEEGITEIGTYSFAGLKYLSDVYLPASLETIKELGFGERMGSSIERVYLPDLAAWLEVDLEGSFVSNPLRFPETLYVNGEEVTELVIPEGVSSINMGAFAKSRFFDSVEIPASVTSIGRSAFLESKVTKVTIHGALAHVEEYAFSGSMVEEVVFTGDAPADWENLFRFNEWTVKVYYPAGNDTWTEEILTADLNVEWIPVEEPAAGDTDGDGVIDDSDVAQLLWHTLFPETYAVAGNADINGDTYVDDSDVAYLLWHTLFPENYPLG